jgi:superoxide dismutase, Cu-Zn family
MKPFTGAAKLAQISLATLALTALISACATRDQMNAHAAASETVAAPSASADFGKKVTAPITDRAGGTIGEVTLTEGAHGVLIHITLSSGKLAPGWHGLHLHEKADCSDAALGFKLSGSHVGHNPNLQHGLLNPMGSEPGDLPNLYVGPNGAAGGEFFSTAITLAGEARGGLWPLLGPNGAALIIHANPDDQASQPIGGAGERLACAAIKG